MVFLACGKRYVTLLLLSCTFLLCGCREIEHNITAGTLAVEDQNEIKGGGDDVMIGALYFTSNFGAPSSSDVVYRPIRKLADNIDGGNVVTADRTQVLNFDWTDFLITDVPEEKSYSQTSTELSTEKYGFSFEGAIFIAVEEDNVGDARVRVRAEGLRDRLQEALERFIEDEEYQLSIDNELSRRAYVEDRLRCFQDFVLDDLDCEIPGDRGVYYSTGSTPGHDVVGIAQLYFIGTENRRMINQIRELFPSQRWFGPGQIANLASNCGGSSAADVHVCEFIDNFDTPINNEINLLFRGADAVWVLNLQNTTAIAE